jgi:hypothetical protein
MGGVCEDVSVRPNGLPDAANATHHAASVSYDHEAIASFLLGAVLMTARTRFTAWSAFALAAIAAAPLAARTIVEVTDKVINPDVLRLGVHFSNDNYWDSAISKVRLAENFEGTLHKLHLWGEEQPDPDGFMLIGENNRVVPEFFMGAKAYPLVGPDQFEPRTVVGFEMRDHPTRNQKALFVKLDQPTDWSSSANWNAMGLLLVQDQTLDDGQHPHISRVQEWRLEYETVDGERRLKRTFDERYVSPAPLAEVVTGDTPADDGGFAAFKLDGGDQTAFLHFPVVLYNAMPFDGRWEVTLDVKAVSGSPRVTVKTNFGNGPTATVEPGPSWAKHTVDLDVPTPHDPDGNPLMFLEFEVEGGAVLVDNLKAWMPEESQNPTPFRDPIVEVFEDLNPGVVRYLRNSRDSFANMVQPAIGQHTRRDDPHRREGFGTHEFYAFCAHLGAEPWANMAGTILPDEIDQMMEYHAAPADVGFGKVRAELGQEAPWTDVFDRIYIQFGNEVITFFGTGFQGPEYWSALIERAKQSPYYDPDKFVFVINKQGGGIRWLSQQHPEFDAGTINGYHIFGVYDEQIERAGDLEGFYDWVFASAWHMWKDERNNGNWRDLQAMRDLDMIPTVYEGGNYHSTFSTEGKAPMERINRMNAGHAGGVSATHTMLLLMKHWKAGAQLNFNLSQRSFSPGGAFGNLPGAIRGWGGVLNIGDPETRRYRPRFLALKMANEAIFGDLVETIHTGDDPTFEVTNLFGAAYSESRKPELMTVKDIPRVHSYAFADGNKRGLILVSNDPRETQHITVKFDGSGKSTGDAIRKTLVSNGLEATNEHDWAPDRPQVRIAEKVVGGFNSGDAVPLPPGTIVTLTWEVAD